MTPEDLVEDMERAIKAVNADNKDQAILILERIRNECLPFTKRSPTECWLFKGRDEDAPNIGAKMACDNPRCCNPRHVVMSAEEVQGAEEDIQNTEEEQMDESTETKPHRGRPPKVAHPSA